MSKKIKFIYVSEYAWGVMERPKPSRSFIPKWHKEMKNYYEDDIKIFDSESNATPKKCVPMFDAITSGYTIPLWADVLMEEDQNKNLSISWRVFEDVFQTHGRASRMVPSPPGFYKDAFKYVAHLTVETPPGYSILVLPPIGHQDSPFLPISAIVDSDKPTIDLAFPLWIREGTTGIIEKGTPMVQIIPFKRDNWQSEFDYMTKEKYLTRRDRFFSSTIKNNYFKNTWSRKEYK
jgi:hypothetical protein